MLEVARGNLATLGIANVELVQGEVTHLPLADGSMEAAFANMVLHHTENPASMLQEMVSAVKSGGTIAVTDEVEHPYGWMRQEHADVWLGFRREQVESFFGQVGLVALGYESLGMQ